jgi:hypothetical protein
MILCLLGQSFMVTAGTLSNVVPDAQTITWDPGVRGGVPVRTTLQGSEMATSSTAAQIQTRLDTAASTSNRVVLLAAGSFTINQTLVIPTGVTLRGAGMGTTILNGSGTFSGDSFISFNNGFDDTWSATARTLTSPAKGDTTITTTVAHGWVAGDTVLIDMLEQPAGNPPIDNTGVLGETTWAGRANGQRPVGQLVKIVTVPTTTTATIDPPLYYTYANTPQGVKMTGMTHYAGVEDLTVNNLTSDVNDTVTLFGAVNCWMTNVKLQGNHRRAIWDYNSLYFTFSQNWVVGGVPIATDGGANYISDRAYGFFIGPHGTATHIYDNIFEKLTMGTAFEGAAAGNVVAYNFMTNMWWETDIDPPVRFGVLMHGPHPFMNLIEGNWTGGRFRADEYWGTSSHWTVLRNRFVQINRGSNMAQRWTIDVERRNWYYSFVGNLIGNSSATGSEEAENWYEYVNGASAPQTGDTHKTLWKIGYESLGEDNTNYDPSTYTTMIRYGNWTPRTNNSISGAGVLYYSTNVVNAASSIPNSGYLSSKPSYFGGLTWPPYDPLSPTSNSSTNLPAAWRYAGLTVPAEGGGTTGGTGAVIAGSGVTFRSGVSGVK